MVKQKVFGMNRKEIDPLITVVTITRNRCELLSRAMASVLTQSYTNIEYIIIDGASTDNTEDVVKSFKDDRVKYIKQKENILSEMNELFINNSSGEYFTFLDDDDEYFANKISKQYQMIKDTPEKIGLVYCWMDYYNSKDNKLIKEHHPTIEGNVYSNQIEKQSIGGTPTLLVKREAFIKNGGWNMTLNHPSDWEMLTRFSRLYGVKCLPEVLVKVNINHQYERQSTHHLTRKKIEIIIRFHKYYLTEFADGFKNNPQKRHTHLFCIAGYYARLGELKKFISYSVKSFKSGSYKDRINDMPFFLKRLLRCILFKRL